MKKALLYIRVSTSKQDQDGYSIPMQKERLVSFCKAKGWVVAGVYIDPGYSGATLDRPGMNALISAVESKKGDVVLVYKLDRLSRSQRDVLEVLEDILEPNGVDFVSMQESFDTSTVYGKAMLGILSVFGAMERGVIVERTMMGRAGRAEKGLFHGGGTSPIGYDYIDGELVINEEEAQQVQKVYELFAAGYTVTEITRRMEGFTTKHGDWSHTSTVGNVLDNPLYAGTVRFDGVLADGQHRAIIDKSLNDRVKALRERLKRFENNNSKYLLTGLIYCASCGARYFPHRRPNGKVVYSCHSRAKKNAKMVKNPSCKAPHIPIKELDAMVEAELLNLAADLSQIKKKASQKGSSDAATSTEEVKRLDDEISRLMDLLQYDSLASVGDIALRIEAAHKEREKFIPKNVESDYRYDIELAKDALRTISQDWNNMDNRGKQSFLVQLIDSIQITTEGIRVAWSFE